MRLDNRVLKLGLIVVAVVTSAGVAVAASVFAGGYTDAEGRFHGCVGKSGDLRVVTPATACRKNESAIAWSETGPVGPQGSPGETVRGFRMIRATPDEVEITAVGSGPIGFPTEDNPPTPILTLDLPKGVYEVSATIAARKAWGNGDLLCWAEYQLDGTRFLPIFTRASMGTDPGHAMRTTVSGGGFVNLSGGAGPVTLACWQASNDAAGSPSGERPHVFYAFLNARIVSRATLRRHGSDVVTEMP